jgi:hypothetical protein
MSASTATPALAGNEAQGSWVPMIVIAMGRALMSFNVASLPVSMSGMVQSFDTPPTTIANHYRGKQQAKAVGLLGSARAIAGVLAFVIVGFVAQINWRLAFGLLIVHAAAILLLTRPAAPFDFVGVSPAPVMIAVGIAIFMSFFVWSHKQAAAGKTPLLALEVVDSPREWAAVLALFIVVMIEGSINFLVPLYIQIIQGRSSAATSVAMMPFMLTVFFTAILIVRLYGRFSPRQIARCAYVLVSVGALWLAFVVRNDGAYSRSSWA